MKRITSWLLALILALSVSVGAFASMPDNAGSPDFEISTVIYPGALTIYQGQQIEFKAVTTYTSNKTDSQWLHFVNDSWTGVDIVIPATATTPATATPTIVVADSAAEYNERRQVFEATAYMFVSDEPGQFDVYVTYTIMLQHDFSGTRSYRTVTTSIVITIDVLEGTPDTDVIDGLPAQGGLLNHGQIVSAWTHWKQKKGNETFLAGGPGVYWSLNWYKAQVEYKEFTSVQQVYDYLDSIYEPQNRHEKKDKKDKN